MLLIFAGSPVFKPYCVPPIHHSAASMRLAYWAIPQHTFKGQFHTCSPGAQKLGV